MTLAVSIMAVPVIVNAASPREVKAVIAACADNGTEVKTGPELAVKLAIDPSHPVKELELKVTKDGIDVDGLGVLVSVPPKPQAPSHLILLRKTAKGVQSSSRYYRVSANGDLERAFLLTGTRDEKGRAVRGSGQFSELSATDPGVKKAFAKEMAEMKKWLKKELAKRR